MLWYTLRFNLGTMALGSLILSVVEVLRMVLEVVDRQTRQLQEGSAAAKVVMRCCKCFLFCFERCVKFISSYAYIYVFMENKGFCAACFDTYRLISDHPAQLAINSIVQGMLFIIQSTSIPLACALMAYNEFIEGVSLEAAFTSKTLVHAVVPSVAVLLLSYIMARSFAGVYEEVINALTVCVLHDLKAYDAKYTRDQLRKAFDLGDKTFGDDDDDDEGDWQEDSKASLKADTKASQK